MYPYSSLPKPLPLVKFSVLLALCRGESARYELVDTVCSDSLGSVVVAPAQVYRAVKELQDEVFIELSGIQPGRVSGTKKEIYSITEYGRIRLREEITRLEQAVKIARHAGVMDDETPLELQRLRLDLFDRREG